jgi:transposase
MNTERSNSIPNPSPTRPDAPTPTPPNNDTTLPDDVATLKAMIHELIASLHKSQRECEGVQQRLDLLLRKLYGPKAERFDPNQPWLLPELAPDATPPVEQTPTEESPTIDDAEGNNGTTKKRQGGRKKLPENLERKRIEHTLSEAERMCPCCNQVCQKFGEDVSEQLDYHPGSLFVNQHVRFKYACQKCHDHITVGHVPIAIVNKGLPGPGLLAYIAASKYADHLPLHRLERILTRHGVELSRKTMCDWMAHIAKMLCPVVDLMSALLRESKAIHTDATKMPYLDPAVKGKSLSGQMWAFVGDRDHPFDVFRFGPDHSAACIDAFLKDRHYRGFLSADALNIYDHLFRDGLVLEIGCWAHARRKFHEAKDNDAARSHVAMAHIRRLYAIEKEARELVAARQLEGEAADAVYLELRQNKSLPELTAFKQWLDAEQLKVLPKSLIGLAIAYALNHWQALTRFVNDGFLAIDNNVAERTLRTIAILQRLAHDAKPTPEQLREWLPDRWKPPATADSS